ncbi:hypothetical protein Ddye_019160 [Dipteronia dyeriana]|uniref:AAA+ ATPase domain-containing protein n=1 Tax=Dipteronia dyeriana TaxID=168575 RepID=A0AAD9WVR3_9ROSI|nr:hypothetical protein Ddye_019160 [Dipteronia dyeriana]
MAESAISIVGEIAVEHVVDSIAAQLSYIRNYKTNFENLEKQVKNLQGRRDEVQHKVEEATRNGDKIEEVVQNWLDSVNNMIKEATDIIEDNKRLNMRCFKSLCPDLKKRYLQSQKARKKTDDVSKLHNEGTFDRVSYRTLPAETWHPDSYENIKSRHSTMEGLLNALHDRDVNMIGVHGMGGSGKTTLVREVAKKAEEDKLFNQVVFAEVSDTVDIRKIQGVIAERLGLKFHEDTEPVRADRLRERIMQETKILLILDNIWKDLDLAAMGIPFGNSHVGCKLLLTSRDMDLLNVMGSQRNFFVDVLEEEEARSLFMKIAGVGVEQHGLGSLAFEVAKECGGLLVAIITVAKALKNKQQCEWNVALVELRDPSYLENVEGSVVKKAYMSIQLSYKHLESEELKSTFLLCSIMGRTHDASIEELLRYAVGLRLFKVGNTMEDLRDKAKTFVRKLKDSSLLLGTPDTETFSIHDVIRDVGRWIARKDEHKVTVTNGIPRQWEGENILQNCTSITLHDILELPKPLECPQLQFFYMKTKTPFIQVPDNFFKGMPNLIVLHLIQMNLSPLPASFRLLKKLRTLNLERCCLEDIAEMKDMENLEILVVGFESVNPWDPVTKQLPEEIGQLNRLRVLDLRDCSFIIRSKTILRLTQLEELYMGQWNESFASLEELKDLSHLTALDIRVADAEILPKGLDFFKKLKRYKIVIGIEGATETFIRTLSVASDTNICWEDGVIKQLKGIEDLYLDGEQRVKNIPYELDGEGFPQLKRFSIKNNPYIQFIVDSIPSATCDAFPLLETLSLENLVRLEKICHDQLRAKCFCRLTTIQVRECGKLKNLFSFSIAKHLSQLQNIEVDDCGNMEEIFTIGRTDDVNNTEVIDVVCDQLRSLNLRYLPRLRRICSEAGVTSTSQERPMPLTTDASEDQLDALPLFGEKVVFPNLTTLTVGGCDNLKCLFSSSTLGSLKQFQHLKIHNCKELEELIRIDDNCSNHVEFPSLEKLCIQNCPEIREFIFSDKVSFPSLQEIEIDSMENLKMIWQNQLIESVQYCPKLCNVNVSYCPSLKNLFPASITRRSLLQLEKLHVSFCGIKEIVSKEERIEKDATRFVFPRLSSLELYSLEELGCFYPGKHTTEWPKLRELKVEYGEKIDLFNFQKKNEDQLDVSVQQQQHLFMVDKAFSNLEKVTIFRNHATIICQSSYPEDLFPNLEFLEVSHDKSAVFPLDILLRFHNLKNIILGFSSYKEIFSFELVEKHARTLAQIKSLGLVVLSDLKQLWKQDSKMDHILQKLEFLRIYSCDSLIILMPPSASFENLKKLEVSSCFRLLSLVVASTAKSLVRLEEMSIFFCVEMTEILANEGDVLEGEIIFRRLKILKLEVLINLTCFCSGNYTLSFPLLEKLTIADCPKMQIFSGGVLRTPNLKLVSLDRRNYDWECDNLNTDIKQHREKEVFSKSILSGDDIRVVWQIFPERTKVFSNAKELYLIGNDIRMIWQSQTPEHIFPNVKCLHLFEDESTVFPFGIFQKFHNVAKLDLKSSSYKEIFPHEEVQKHEGELPQIRCLRVTELHDLEQMWKPSSKLDSIPINLEILEVRRCKSLINVLLPSSSFGHLKILEVEGCERLISLVSASAAKSLVLLEEMQICNCKMMTEVVANEGDITEEDKILFHKLKKLELNDLSSLTSFSFGNYTLKIPVLEKLKVKECPNMMIFSSRDLNTPMLREVWQDQTEYTCENDLNKIVQQHHEETVFTRKKLHFESIRIILQKFVEHHKVFSNLEELSFSRDEIRMLWQSQFPQHVFPKLELLEVSGDESTVFQLSILERFQNVKKLELNFGSYEEILSCEDVEKHAGTLAQIKSLSLYRLDDLKQMFKQDSKMDLNLEKLEVKWCGSLVTLIPPSASFRNLRQMTVEGCHRLMSFLAPSTAKCLIQLEYMSITECNMMTEVFSENEGAEFRDEIIFKNLSFLQLDGLSSLTSFCSGKYTFNFPCLVELFVNKCPKIKKFSSGVLNTPKLQRILHDYTDHILDGDLNATIHGIHEKLNNKSSTEDCAGPSVLSPTSSAI